MDNVSLKLNSLCNAYGFSKTGGAYCRCIGDGIFQIISQTSFPLSFRRSIKYSKSDSRIISIGIRSMFSEFHNSQHSDLKYLCEYFPENFIGTRFDLTSYQGLDIEIGLMESNVFPFLDSILTQKDLIEAVCYLDKTQFGLCIPHRIELVAPYLICDERDQALMRLYGMYAQNYLNFQMKNCNLKTNGQYREYIEAENLFEQNNSNLKSFLISVLGNKKQEINDLLLCNLQKNIKFAKDNRIRFSDDFQGDKGTICVNPNEKGTRGRFA